MTIQQQKENDPANQNTVQNEEGCASTLDKHGTAPEDVSNDGNQTQEQGMVGNKKNSPTTKPSLPSFVRSGLPVEIAKQVVRQKLAKLRHLVLRQAISSDYLDSLFPRLLQHFDPQTVTYNGGIANITEWKISCYLEVMEGGVPTTEPNVELLQLFHPLLDACNDLFLYWFRQKSACNTRNKFNNNTGDNNIQCSRLMTFITRYTPAPGEQALLKVFSRIIFCVIMSSHYFESLTTQHVICFDLQHVDGSGKVDGSVVVALPIDRWSAPESTNSFVGHGGVSHTVLFSFLELCLKTETTNRLCLSCVCLYNILTHWLSF